MIDQITDPPFALSVYGSKTQLVIRGLYNESRTENNGRSYGVAANEE